MKVRLEKGNLIQILQKVQNITDKKSSMPVLSNVLISSSEQQTVEFSATDLELSLWTQTGGQVETPGSSTVSARKLFEIVRELPQPEVLLEGLPNNKMQILSGRARFELSTIPGEDFPQLNFYRETELVKVDAAALKRALTKTLHSVPADEDSFSIAGTFLHAVNEDSYRFVSSDGHRLSYCEVPKEAFGVLDIREGLIIPRKGVQEILRMLEKEEEVVLGVHEKYVVLRTPSTFLSVQLLDAEFPEYKTIIPEERPFFIMLDLEQFFSALKRSSILSNNVWRHVRFILTKGVLELEAGNPELGNANETLDVEYEGEDFSVAFNIRYLLETIQALDSPRMRFEWVDQFHGGVFVGAEDPGFLSLVMPMVV